MTEMKRKELTENNFDTKEEIQSLRVYVLILSSALKEDNKTLAENSIKEIVSILGQVSFVYNLWSGVGVEKK